MTKLYQRPDGAYNINIHVRPDVAPHLAAALKVLDRVAQLELQSSNNSLVLQAVVLHARQLAEKHQIPWPDPFIQLNEEVL